MWASTRWACCRRSMSAMRCATPTSPLPAASDSTAGASGHAHGLMEEGKTMGRKAGDIAAVVLLANALSLAIAGAATGQSTSAATERIAHLDTGRTSCREGGG